MVDSVRAEVTRRLWPIAAGLAVVMIVLLVLFIVPIAAEISRRLPNGYRVVYTDNYSAIILDGADKDVIGPHITAWKSADGIVFGKLDTLQLFIVDTEDRSVIASEDVAVIVDYAVKHGVDQGNAKEIVMWLQEQAAVQ